MAANILRDLVLGLAVYDTASDARRSMAARFITRDRYAHFGHRNGIEVARSVETDELLRRVGQLGFILSAPPEVAQPIANAFEHVGTLHDAREGQVLLNQGDARGNQGFLLLTGKAEVVKEGETVAKVGAPALIGEMQQFSISGTRSATVRIASDADVLQFDWKLFYEALEPRLSPLEFQSVKDSIRRYSWRYIVDED